MDRAGDTAGWRHEGTAQAVLAHADVEADAADAVGRLRRGLGLGPFALIVLFMSPVADMEAISSGFSENYPGVAIVGCSTAGEISSRGYDEGRIVAIGFKSAYFAASTLLVPDLTMLNGQALIHGLLRLRQDLALYRPEWTNEFGFLLCDGLSMREDELMAALAPGLGPLPLFGGSAGDGIRFGRSYVLHEGKLLGNAAILTVLRTLCPVRVFSMDHLSPTNRRMVVTEAEPARRIVRQINGEPAAREYARLLGKDPARLDPFTFAAHPVVVRTGGRHHVRSIQRMLDNGDLVFFSAIGEGIVLTLAEAKPMAEHLEAELAALSAERRPEAVLAFDCILRRFEAEEKQVVRRMSELLRENRVVGFSTYGEQRESLHVNQTMTGVAIYPPNQTVKMT